MIHECFRFEGFDAASYDAFVSLLRPSRALGADRVSRKVGLLVVVVDEDGAVLGAVHSNRGRITNISSAHDPEALAHVHGAARVVVFREGALEDLAERISLRVRREQGYLEQLITVLESMREIERAGALRVHPGTLSHIPIPSADSIRRAFDLIASDGHVSVLAIHGEKNLESVIAFRRRDGAIDGIFGPGRILPFAGELEGHFERDHQRIVAAVDREIGPVQSAFSMREGVARKLIAQRTPGALSAAVAARELYARPAPPWLSVGVGVDTVASALYGISHAIGISPLGSAFGAALSSAAGLSSLPGREAIESWLELFTPRVRR